MWYMQVILLYWHGFHRSTVPVYFAIGCEAAIIAVYVLGVFVCKRGMDALHLCTLLPLCITHSCLSHGIREASIVSVRGICRAVARHGAGGACGICARRGQLSIASAAHVVRCDVFRNRDFRYVLHVGWGVAVEHVCLTCTGVAGFPIAVHLTLTADTRYWRGLGRRLPSSKQSMCLQIRDGIMGIGGLGLGLRGGAFDEVGAGNARQHHTWQQDKPLLTDAPMDELQATLEKHRQGL